MSAAIDIVAVASKRRIITTSGNQRIDLASGIECRCDPLVAVIRCAETAGFVTRIELVIAASAIEVICSSIALQYVDAAKAVECIVVVVADRGVGFFATVKGVGTGVPMKFMIPVASPDSTRLMA